MLVGTAGTGKSVLVGTKLASLDAEEYLVKSVPFNYYTTSAMLQGEGPEHVDVGGRGRGCLSGHVPGRRNGAKHQHLLGLTSPVPTHPSHLSCPFSTPAPLFHSSCTLHTDFLIPPPAFLPGLSDPSQARRSTQSSSQDLDAKES